MVKEFMSLLQKNCNTKHAKQNIYSQSSSAGVWMNSPAQSQMTPHTEITSYKCSSYKESFFNRTQSFGSRGTESQCCSWPSAKVTEKETSAIIGNDTSINSPDKIEGILEQISMSGEVPLYSKSGTSWWHVPFTLYKTLRAILSCLCCSI